MKEFLILSSKAWADFGNLKFRNDQEIINMLIDIFPRFKQDAYKMLKGLNTYVDLARKKK